MTGFSVDTGALSSYGQSWHDWGADEVTRLAAYTREYAGQTGGMTGLLAVLAPGVRELAELYAQHYTSLATVVAGTGSGLLNTAHSYRQADHGSAAKLDATMPSVGSQTDVTETSGGSISSVYMPFPATQPESDPAQPIRDDMSFDVKAIDWLFEKATGHHITEPIDYMVGNWTTLTAQGEAWGNLKSALTEYGGCVLENTDGIDLIWDGTAATTFKEYGHRLGDGLKGEAAVCDAVKLVLDQLAKQFKECFSQAVDLLQSVIHQVEAAAAWLAALWWCGVGEAAAAEKAGEAAKDFYDAYKLAHRIELAIKLVNGAVAGFEKLKDLWNLVTNAPAEISAKIDELKGLLEKVGAVPGELGDLTHLPATPTNAYGGPSDPGIS